MRIRLASPNGIKKNITAGMSIILCKNNKILKGNWEDCGVLSALNNSDKTTYWPCCM